MKNIVITGACGGIGSHLVPFLLNNGWRVVALDNLSSGSWENLEAHPNLHKETLDLWNNAPENQKIEWFEAILSLRSTSLSLSPTSTSTSSATSATTSPAAESHETTKFIDWSLLRKSKNLNLRVFFKPLFYNSVTQRWLSEQNLMIFYPDELFMK